MDYVIIVNDNGELKTISASELVQGGFNFTIRTIEEAIDAILDARSAAEEAAKALADDHARIDRQRGYTADQRVADDTEHANRGQR